LFIPAFETPTNSTTGEQSNLERNENPVSNVHASPVPEKWPRRLEIGLVAT
jgi:hypothetical protein